jgi:two-component system, OmpR family, KDP operon response regulator KdpE
MTTEAVALGATEANRAIIHEALTSMGYRVTSIDDVHVEPPATAGVLVVDLSTAADKALDAIHNYRVVHAEAVIMAIGGEGSGVATAALEEGADVHIPGGVRATQIGAQLRAIRRRTAKPEPDRITVGLLELDMKGRTVTARGKDMRLTPGEFKVLAYLAENAGSVVSHTDIYYATHPGAVGSGDSREPVKVLISRLRQKLEDAGLTAPNVRTVRGFGYVLDRRAREVPRRRRRR